MPSLVESWPGAPVCPLTRTIIRTGGAADDYRWVYEVAAVDLAELSQLYRIAPLGEKPPDALATVFGNSRFACFVYAGDVLVGAGRALAAVSRAAGAKDSTSTRTLE